MYYLEIYLIPGLALFLVILWDYKALTEAVNRQTKQLEDGGSKLPHAVLVIWNVALFVGHTVLLWPVVVVMEYFASKGEK